MEIRKLYPNGKKKAFNITYDDGVLQDVRFVELLNRYGIPGTFNLNAQLMESEFEWVHPCGMTVKRLPLHAVKELYAGHEVASHTLTHPYLDNLDREEIFRQMYWDKRWLESVLDREVVGFAVPFEYYDETIRGCVQEAGFLYGRNAVESGSFTPPDDPYAWSCTVFHLNPQMYALAQAFQSCEEELALFQIVGHAYDLDTDHMWEAIEDILRQVSSDPDIVCMTHAELVRYLNAMRCCKVRNGKIVNPSGIPMWFEIDGAVQCIAPQA